MDIEHYLNSFSNETIYFCPNPGNAGDAIIALATYQIFKKLDINYKIAKIGDDLQNKVVFYGGGGQLVNIHSGYGLNFITTYKDIVKKLVILPHTINLNQNILSSLGNNVDIICRENISFNYIKKIHGKFNYFISDDMAFSLNLEELLKQKWYLLPKSFYNLKNLYHCIKFLIMSNIKNLSNNKVANSYRNDIEKTDIKIPSDNYDISAQFGAQIFKEKIAFTIGYHIINYINKFDLVNTNRLHIAISGALLGKTVNLYPNSYWKNKAVYEYSMKTQYPNVNWMNN